MGRVLSWRRSRHEKVVDDARSRWRRRAGSPLRRWRRIIARGCRGRSRTRAAARCPASPSRCAMKPPASRSTRHRRRRALSVRLRRSGQLHHHRGAAGIPRGAQQSRARAAARRRHRRSGDGAGGGRRDHHGAGLVAAGAVQFEQLGHDARAAAGRPGADQRAQPVQPGQPRSVDRQHAGTTAAENRPYHHAYANDYDAGGGTRRANAVLLDGVALGASYKTSYTPSMDAVEEITVSKNSVDAENGNSLGGLISLNMKSGTNTLRGSAYMFGRDPSMNSIADPTIAVAPGQDTSVLRGTKLKMYGATLGGPIKQSQHLQLHVVRAVGRQAPAVDRAHRADRARAARRLQPVRAERPGAHHLQPVHVDARLRPAASCGSRSRTTQSRRRCSIRSR